MRVINQGVIAKFRSGAGMGGMPKQLMLLLTTTGRRSGAARTVPMMFTRIDGVIVVAASNSGAAHSPLWYENLVVNPAVTVETSESTFVASARPVDDARYDAVWQAVTARMPM